MRTPWLVLAGTIAIAGCKKESSSPSGGLPAPAAPASTTEADALWGLAPEGALVGIVISPRAIAMTEHAWKDVRALMAAAPELAIVNAMLGNEIASVFGKPDITLADVGLTPAKGAAFFFSPDGGGIAVVPMGDRDKLIAATHGTKGTDSDQIGKATCKTINGFYICARTPDWFAKVGKAKLKDKLTAWVGTRGDVEVVADVKSLVGGEGAGVLQLAKGTVVVRASMTGLPPQVASKLTGKQATAPGDRATTAGFAVLSFAEMLKGVPPLPLVTGVTLADLASSINGPMTVYIPSGTFQIDTRLPLSDPKPASAFVEHCAEIPGLAAMGASFSNGACHMPFAQMGITLDLWVEGNELRAGRRDVKDKPVPVPMTAIGSELAKQPALFAFWGRGTLLGKPLAPMPKLPVLPPEVQIGIRAFTLINEIGLSSRIDGNKISMTFALRTLWSNPDDVIAKLTAITPQMFLDGTASDAAQKVALASPGAPFAADYAAGQSGMLAPVAVIGMLAAVAVPAFMDYMKKSKKSEAALQLNKLAKNAKTYYIENAAYPVGDAPLTPVTPCCQGPKGKCEPAGAAWLNRAWTELDFQIDEPTLYQYSYHSDGKTLDAEAVGDLDCDGISVSWKLHMDSEQGNPTATITEPPRNTD